MSVISRMGRLLAETNKVRFSDVIGINSISDKEQAKDAGKLWADARFSAQDYYSDFDVDEVISSIEVPKGENALARSVVASAYKRLKDQKKSQLAFLRGTTRR